jgi:hypothetical protein
VVRRYFQKIGLAGPSVAEAEHVIEALRQAGMLKGRPQDWARLLLARDDVQGRKVLERMLAYYEEHDGKADDFGRLFIVIDASIALGRERV